MHAARLQGFTATILIAFIQLRLSIAKVVIAVAIIVAAKTNCGVLKYGWTAAGSNYYMSEQWQEKILQ
jgi:hypothetical protein